MCSTLRLSTPIPPKGALQCPWSPTRGTHSAERNTWATTRSGDRCSAIRAPRSGRILLWRSPISQLVNTVVSEVRKRAFQPAVDLGTDLQAAEMRQAREKKWRPGGMRPSTRTLTIHRTVTTRRADFAVYLTRRDRRLGASVMMLVHEECRITCGDHHRHSLNVVSGSLRQLRLRAKSKRNTRVVCSRLCADGRASGTRNRGKRNPERPGQVWSGLSLGRSLGP
jgi:hypothetical protein